MAASKHLIVALDVASLEKAAPLIETLAPHVGLFKIGLELLSSVGAPQAVEFIHKRGGKVFFDGKFCDIPNTVEKAASAVAALGVAMFDVHANCGKKAIEGAVRNRRNSAVLAVTVLTSIDDNESTHLYGAKSAVKVKQFAMDALAAGVQGIVCSPHELPLLAEISSTSSFFKVTPGVRPRWASTGDQKRVLTPAEAIQNGATHLVIGRPILDPPREIGGPLEATKRILEEIESVL